MLAYMIALGDQRLTNMAGKWTMFEDVFPNGDVIPVSYISLLEGNSIPPSVRFVPSMFQNSA